MKPGLVKVGRTNDPSRRLATFRTSNLDIGYLLRTPTLDASRAEAFAHAMLKRYRLPRTEWFEVPAVLAQMAVCTAIIEMDGVPVPTTSRRKGEE